MGLAEIVRYTAFERGNFTDSGWKAANGAVRGYFVARAVKLEEEIKRPQNAGRFLCGKGRPWP